MIEVSEISINLSVETVYYSSRSFAGVLRVTEPKKFAGRVGRHLPNSQISHLQITPGHTKPPTRKGYKYSRAGIVFKTHAANIMQKPIWRTVRLDEIAT